MKFSKTTLTSCLLAASRSASAFTPAGTTGGAMRSSSRAAAVAPAFLPKIGYRQHRTTTAAATVTALNANVLKLSDPGELLDNVDIFIFDCDGVIWRVRWLATAATQVLSLIIGAATVWTLRRALVN